VKKHSFGWSTKSKGNKPASETAQKYGVYPTQVGLWKKGFAIKRRMKPIGQEAEAWQRSLIVLVANWIVQKKTESICCVEDDTLLNSMKYVWTLGSTLVVRRFNKAR